MKEGSLTLGRQFFVKERDSAYSNWPYAFWRELIQNSVDAGATEIHIKGIIEITEPHIEPPSATVELVGADEVIYHNFPIEKLADLKIKKDQDAKLYLEVLDNGCGMSRDTLENIYLRLGASSKAGAGSVGGFGRARMLTCFAMDSYGVDTRRHQLRGVGPNYQLNDVSEGVDGCRLFARTYFSLRKSYTFYNSLMQLLDCCDLPHVKFFFNGKLLKPQPSPVGEELMLMQTPGSGVWGRMYKAPEQETARMRGQLVVRVAGLFMFMQYIGYAPGLVLEIDPTVSRQVLVSNRDQLMAPYSGIIYELVHRVAKRGLRAFDGPVASRHIHYEGKQGRFISMYTDNGKAFNERLQVHEEQYLLQAYLTLKKGAGSIYDNLQEHKVHAFADFMPDIHFSVEDNTGYEDADVEAWMPENWKFKIAGDRIIWHKDCLPHVQFFLAWTAAVRYAVTTALRCDTLSNWRALDSIRIEWMPGIVLAKDTHAVHKQITVGDASVHVFSINPLSFNPSLPLRIFYATDAGLRMLLSAAVHEVCHVEHNDHDENFAITLTRMLAIIDQEEGLQYMRRSSR